VLTGIEVRTTDLPAIVEAMSRSSTDVRYAALTFGTPDRPGDRDGLNIQISAENGKIGFDWVLLSPGNIEDQEKFEAFARAHGAEPLRRSMNGVSYLRVEHGDPARFAANVVTNMYRRPANEPLGLFHEGFVWP